MEEATQAICNNANEVLMAIMISEEFEVAVFVVDAFASTTNETQARSMTGEGSRSR